MSLLFGSGALLGEKPGLCAPRLATGLAFIGRRKVLRSRRTGMLHVELRHEILCTDHWTRKVSTTTFALAICMKRCRYCESAKNAFPPSESGLGLRQRERSSSRAIYETRVLDVSLLDLPRSHDQLR
jgi:hypothetical protein